MRNITAEPAGTQRVLTVAEYAARYGSSRTKAFDDIKTGRLLSFKSGRKRLIPVDAAEALLQDNLRLAREGRAK